MSSRPLLVAEHIDKSFGGLAALCDVSLAINAGEIFGLIGPNGAGKTTLFNVLTCLYTATGGQVHFDGHALLGRPPHTIVHLGLARTFQNIRLFANMSALENVMVGRHCRTTAGVWGAITRSTAVCDEEACMRTRAYELLDIAGIRAHAQALAKHLSYGDQRRLEIARALATEPKLLALDEPAAGMNPSERAALDALLRKIRADGVTILIIEHDVQLIMGLCDRIAVLNFGQLIALGTPDAVQNDRAVIEAYLGDEP